MALAGALARRQVSTLLVHADLQRQARAPNETSYEGPGLAEVLRGDIDLIEALDVSAGSGLTVLHTGAPGVEGEARIFSHEFSDILEHGLRRFQITIVDCPPANRSTASFHAARTTGYSLLVARRNISFAQDLTLFADQMRQVGAEVVGSVLTG
jgi:tyrosine-protein kinase Etk/Wzc